MSVLGYENKTANGEVTIPTGCNYVVAVCVGSIDPPYLNGVLMQTYASVTAQGLLKAISIHILPNSINQILPFVMNGADSIAFIFLDDAVCTRLPAVSGYSASGSVTGDLVTSTDDIVIGIVLGSVGQVLLTGDSGSLTLVYDTLKCRIGYIVPGDSILTCLGTDEISSSGEWYYPPRYWVDTTTSVLVEPGHYVSTPVYNRLFWAFMTKSGTNWVYGYYFYKNPPGSTTGPNGTQSFATYQGQSWTISEWTTYVQTWVPDRYETQSSGYWVYPPREWVLSGTQGQISAAFISIADVMIGANYISRPLIS